MKRIFLTIAMLLWAASAHAAIWYVDNAATGSNNGTSWANAWTNITNASGLAAGDTVYISGGSSSKSYSISSWAPASGSSGNPITWRVGQDTGHNGTVILNGGSYCFGNNFHDVTFDGNYGGSMHIQVQNCSNQVWQPTGSIGNVKFKYINFPSNVGGFWFNQIGTVNGLEWDHCYIKKVDAYPSDKTNTWWAMYGSTWDSNSIHDCEIHYPVKSSDPGYGDDVVQWASGLTAYNNKFIADYTTYANYQHADVFQLNQNYNRIYNNYFQDVGESIVYEDSYSSVHTINGLLFYNNIVANTHAQVGGGYPRGLDLQPEAGGSGSSFSNIYIVNNTFVDFDSPNFLFTVRIDGSTTASCTNCVVSNNIMYNGGNMSLMSGVTSANNTTSSSVQFTTYSHYGGQSNNLRLKSTDTIAKDHGTTIANYGTANFALDKDGVSRPQGAAWDIGAYEFGSGSSGGTVVKPMPPTLLQ